MRMGNKGWPVWSDPTDELLMLKLLKKLVVVLIERCQNTKCIAVCCIWGCIAANQSGCPCWHLSTAESTTMIMWASELGHGAMEEGGLVWYIMFSFTSRGWPGVCASHTWGTHGTRMHYGKKGGRRSQCDALGNILLGNLGSCHLCGCYSDTYHLPKHCCRPCTLFHRNGIPWWLWPLSVG